MDLIIAIILKSQLIKELRVYGLKSKESKELCYTAAGEFTDTATSWEDD